MDTKRRPKAFTLLELIVTLLVIAIIAAVAIPTFNTVKANAAKRTLTTTAQTVSRDANAIARSGMDTSIGTDTTDANIETAIEEAFPGISSGPVNEWSWDAATNTLTFNKGSRCYNTVIEIIDAPDGGDDYAAAGPAASCEGNPGGPTTTVGATAPDAPGSILAMTGTVPETDIDLTWSAPLSDGGSAITDYQVRAYVGGTEIVGSPRLVGSATTSFSYTGLTASTTYTFKVAAINSAGTSPLSAESDPFPTQAPFVPSDGSLDTAWAADDYGIGMGTDGGMDAVYGVAVQSDGRTLIAGEFTTVNGQPLKRLARLNSDGTIDVSFNIGTGFNRTINAIAVQPDGKILLGGTFDIVADTYRSRIVRLNSDGTIDGTFTHTSGANGTVNAIAVQSDGKIIIAGAFSSYNGTARARVARINADGTIDASFNPGVGPSNTVNTVAVQSDGKIIIGGQFTSVSATGRNRIARLNSDGTLDTSFTPGTGANNTLNASAIDADGKILIGGAFTTIDGTTRNRIARLNTDGTLDTSFTPGTGASGAVRAITVQADTKIIIGGQFSTYNGTTVDYSARITSTGALERSFGTNSEVYAATVATSGKVVLGGYFVAISGVTRSKFARFNADGTLDTDFAAPAGPTDRVVTAAVQPNGKVIIGGYFYGVANTSRKGVARLNADGTNDTSFNPGAGANSTVNTVALQPDGKILVGGSFNEFNSVPGSIVRLNSDGSVDGSFTAPGWISNVNVIAIQSDGKILVGASAGAGNIFRLNADGTVDATFNTGSGADSNVNGLAIQPDGKIVIGGMFTNYNGTARNYVARINSDGSLDATFNPGTGADSFVFAVAVHTDGKIVVGGWFANFDGVARNGVARLNSNGSLDTGFDPATSGGTSVYAMRVQPDGKVLVGGYPSAFTRLNTDGTADGTFAIGSGVSRDVEMVTVQPDGNILVGGSFITVNGSPRAYLTRFGKLGTPLRPTVTSVSAAAGSATLNWTAPTQFGATAISSYTVQYRLVSAVPWVTVSPGNVNTATISSLAAGTYVFQVRATNANGDGWWSAPVHITVP